MMPQQPRSELESSEIVDNELARLAREGSACAVRMIVRRHDQRLYRIARAIGRDSTEAEDVMQDAYLSAFGSLDKFRADASLATWLTRIVVNKAINHLRRESVMVSLNTAEDVERLEAKIVDLPNLASELDPERATDRSQIRDLLQRAIDNLPEPFRVVLVMRMVEQLSAKRTASSLGIREVTVRTRLHRAKKLMREQLQMTVCTRNLNTGVVADRSDQPFGKAILPRRSWRGRLVPNAHGAQSARDDGTITLKT